jgi:NAD(P)-dependent dehydrogenase (short-subunit alcohol dehydrogenase family)
MDSAFTGRTILITGGASGIGAATGRLLGKKGANVILVDLSDLVDATAEEIRSAGGACRAIRADISNESDVERFVAEAQQAYGRIDGAFNNAGVEQSGLPMADLSAEQWNRVIKIDLTGVFYCMKHEIRAMLKTGGGTIVNTASGLGVVAMQNSAEYVAAKHGVIGLTRAAAVDYGRQGIRVNAILPGVVNTPMVTRLGEASGSPEMMDAIRQAHPIGRTAEAHEISDAALWLLSDASSFVTGAAIAVDGGYTAV